MMHAWHIGCGNGLRAPRIPQPQLLTLPLPASDSFMGEKWDCVSSPGGLKETLQVASEVTYMEHMCLSHLVVAFTLATEEGSEWATRCA